MGSQGTAVGRGRVDPPDVERLVEALLGGDWRAAEGVFRRGLSRGMLLHELGDRMLAPALYQVGDLWEAGRLDVAQEHVASATAQTALALAAGHVELAPPHAGRALFACVEGNRHALGLRVVADAFESQGWRVRYLGGDVPVDDLVHEVTRFHPDVVAFSVALKQHEAPTARAIARLREAFGAQPPRILVGGLLVRHDPAVVTRVGADGGAPDASSIDVESLRPGEQA